LDSDEKKKLESEYDGKYQGLADLAEKYERAFASIKPGERIPGTDQAVKTPEPVDEKSVYAEYGIDPDYADAFQKKLIKDTMDMKNKLNAYESKIGQVESFANTMILKETANRLGVIINEEKAKFPFDEILSEDGKQNLTYNQFASLLLAKEQRERGAGRKVDLDALTRETVRDIHAFQAQSKAKAAPSITNELSPDEIAQKYPELYKKLEDKIRGNAVADYEADKAKVPPSLESKKQEVDLTKVNDKKPNSTEDWINKGFDDPEIRALFQQ